jgi:hypothetical protein
VDLCFSTTPVPAARSKLSETENNNVLLEESPPPERARVQLLSLILLGELLMTSASSTFSLGVQVQSLPALVTRATQRTPQSTRAATVINYLLSYHNNKSESRFNFDTRISVVKKEYDWGISFEEIYKKISETKILDQKDPFKWNWPLIIELAEGALANSSLSNYASSVGFYKKVITFFLPKEKQYSKLSFESANEQYTKTLCSLLTCIFSSVSVEPTLETLVWQISEELKHLNSTSIQSRIKNDEQKAKGVSLEQEKDKSEFHFCHDVLIKTMSRDYFKIIGFLCSIDRGYFFVEKYNILTSLLGLVSTSDNEALISMILDSVDYTLPGQSKEILAKALKSPSRHTRLTITRFLGNVLLKSPSSFDKCIPMIIGQLKGESRIAREAFVILCKACERGRLIDVTMLNILQQSNSNIRHSLNYSFNFDPNTGETTQTATQSASGVLPEEKASKESSINSSVSTSADDIPLDSDSEPSTPTSLGQSFHHRQSGTFRMGTTPPTPTPFSASADLSLFDPFAPDNTKIIYRFFSRDLGISLLHSHLERLLSEWRQERFIRFQIKVEDLLSKADGPTLEYPPHLLGSLSRCKKGCEFIHSKNLVDEMVSIAQGEAHFGIARRAALMSLGIMGSSDIGFAALISPKAHKDAFPTILQALTSPNLPLRGIAYRAISFFTQCALGRQALSQIGWDSPINSTEALLPPLPCSRFTHGDIHPSPDNNLHCITKKSDFAALLSNSPQSNSITTRIAHSDKSGDAYGFVPTELDSQDPPENIPIGCFSYDFLVNEFLKVPELPNTLPTTSHCPLVFGDARDTILEEVQCLGNKVSEDAALKSLLKLRATIPQNLFFSPPLIYQIFLLLEALPSFLMNTRTTIFSLFTDAFPQSYLQIFFNTFFPLPQALDLNSRSKLSEETTKKQEQKESSEETKSSHVFPPSCSAPSCKGTQSHFFSLK